VRARGPQASLASLGEAPFAVVATYGTGIQMYLVHLSRAVAVSLGSTRRIPPFRGTATLLEIESAGSEKVVVDLTMIDR
jgi:hypothetical protein